MPDTRTDAQIKGALAAAATLAAQIGKDSMATPQERTLRDALHEGMNNDLSTLENRDQSSGSTGRTARASGRRHCTWCRSFNRGRTG
ncbi:MULTISPECIES: hypothetical protein [Streptomyces]|uniref:hypothetical protein n=1 Tax=Streptomyces TaxID=1883 RepID=UPI0033AFE417